MSEFDQEKLSPELDDGEQTEASLLRSWERQHGRVSWVEPSWVQSGTEESPCPLLARAVNAVFAQGKTRREQAVSMPQVSVSGQLVEPEDKAPEDRMASRRLPQQASFRYCISRPIFVPLPPTDTTTSASVAITHAVCLAMQPCS